MRRTLVLLFGIACYAVFFATFLYAVGFVSGLIVPKTVDNGPASSLTEALVVDLGLLSLFAVQHSGMARRKFKAWWAQFLPKPVERSTYVLFSSLALIVLFWQWRPITAVVWSIDTPALANAMIALSLLGWLIVLTSTFLINHFELFGLQQVAQNWAGRQSSPAIFRTPFFYKLVRHPIYLGFIIAFWATPHMTVGHLLFAAITTVYILVGIALEERDLIDLFGDQYRSYKARVPMLLPWSRPLPADEATPRSRPPRSAVPGE